MRNHNIYDTPRLVPEQLAAEHVGVPLATFKHWVACGLMPKPLALCDLYDLKAVDLALDRLSGIGSPANALDAWREKRRAG
jgi:hypothetical protein